MTHKVDDAVRTEELNQGAQLLQLLRNAGDTTMGALEYLSMQATSDEPTPEMRDIYHLACELGELYCEVASFVYQAGSRPAWLEV